MTTSRQQTLVRILPEAMAVYVIKWYVVEDSFDEMEQLWTQEEVKERYRLDCTVPLEKRQRVHVHSISDTEKHNSSRRHE